MKTGRVLVGSPVRTTVATRPTRATGTRRPRGGTITVGGFGTEGELGTHRSSDWSVSGGVGAWLPPTSPARPRTANGHDRLGGEGDVLRPRRGRVDRCPRPPPPPESSPDPLLPLGRGRRRHRDGTGTWNVPGGTRVSWSRVFVSARSRVTPVGVNVSHTPGGPVQGYSTRETKVRPTLLPRTSSVPGLDAGLGVGDEVGGTWGRKRGVRGKEKTRGARELGRGTGRRRRTGGTSPIETPRRPEGVGGDVRTTTPHPRSRVVPGRYRSPGVHPLRALRDSVLCPGPTPSPPPRDHPPVPRPLSGSLRSYRGRGPGRGGL